MRSAFVRARRRKSKALKNFKVIILHNFHRAVPSGIAFLFQFRFKPDTYFDIGAARYYLTCNRNKMKNRRVLRWAIIVFLLIVNIGCDQISKVVVRQSIDYKEIIPLNDFITLTKVENTGAFLSAGDSLGRPLRIFLLAVIPTLALLFGLWYIFRKTELTRSMLVGLSFMIGGGIGNLYDRIAYGSVTDFLHVDFVIFETGIFNLADVSIMIGVATVLVSSFYQTREAESINE